MTALHMNVELLEFLEKFLILIDLDYVYFALYFKYMHIYWFTAS